MTDASFERGCEKLLDDLRTWGPILAALEEAERHLREARFLLLGGGTTPQIAAVLEDGVTQIRKVMDSGIQ